MQATYQKLKESLSYVINYQEKQVILFRVFTCTQKHLVLGFSHFFVSHTLSSKFEKNNALCRYKLVSSMNLPSTLHTFIPGCV